MTNSSLKTKPGRTVDHEVRLEKYINYERDVFGVLSLGVVDNEISFAKEDAGANTWAKIEVRGKPDEIEVRFEHQFLPGVRAHARLARETLLRPATDKIPALTVPVHWRHKKDDNDYVPNVIVKRDGKDINNDNMDIVMHNDDGEFIMLEPGILTRKKSFYLGIQEVFAGRVARTNVANAKKAGLTYVKLDGSDMVGVVLPIWQHCAYPGNDFLKTWNEMGERIVRIIHDDGRSVPFSAVEAAKWEPVDVGTPSKEGYLRGVCSFFNIAWGGGYILVKDPSAPGGYAKYFAHFSEIEDNDRGPVAALQPMDTVYEFCPEVTEKGARAREVRAVA